MRIELEGVIGAAVAAVIGTFEPFTAFHGELIRALAAHARTCGLVPVPIVLDPHPISFRRGPWPVFDPLEERIAWLRDLGMSAVAICRCDPGDEELGAVEFFEALAPHLTLGQLLLGHRQTLGPDSKGSLATVEAEAAKRGFEVLAYESPAPVLRLKALLRMGDGHLAEVVRGFGRAPVRRLSDRCDCARWYPGEYVALVVRGDEASREVVTATIDAHGRITWPQAQASAVALVGGPADRRESVPDDGVEVLPQSVAAARRARVFE